MNSAAAATKFDFLTTADKTTGCVMIPKKHLQECFHGSGEEDQQREMFRIGYEREYSQFYLLQLEKNSDQSNHPGVFAATGSSSNYKPEDSDTCIGCREKFSNQDKIELLRCQMPELNAVLGVHVHSGAPLCASVGQECLIVMKMLVDGRPPPDCAESDADDETE